jgi:transposase
MGRREDPSDINDEEWTILEPLIPPAKPGGRVRTSNMRARDQCAVLAFPVQEANGGLCCKNFSAHHYSSALAT